MEDVLDVYHRPHDPKRPQVCMDELSKQLVDEVREPIPMKPGVARRYDTEYERKGVVNLFMVTEPLASRREVVVTDRRTKHDWAHLIERLVDEWYPEADRIVLVLDNLNTHTGGALYEAFPPDKAHRLLEKLELHYTPTHGSWLNMAEIELSVLSRQCLDRRIPDKETLTREVAAWVAGRNVHHGTITWRFTTAAARIKLKRLYPSVEA